MDFHDLSLACAPWVAPQTMAAIVKTESQFNPLAININGGKRLERQPANKEEAIITARWLIANHYNIDLGLGQVNSVNLAKTKLSIADAFDPCKNLAAAATILKLNYDAASRKIPGEQAAFHAAISAYNTGSFVRGHRNGYVQKVLNNASTRTQQDQQSKSVANVRAKDRAWSVGLQAEVTFGNAPKEAKTSDLDEALSKYQKRDYAPNGYVSAADQSKAVANSQPLLDAHSANQSKTAADLNYNFLELNRKDQQKVLNMMASAFKKEHPDMTMREARTELLDRLAASNYFVNAHGTSSYRDDTVLEITQVASR